MTGREEGTAALLTVPYPFRLHKLLVNIYKFIIGIILVRKRV
jgi:hypothetical protein